MARCIAIKRTVSITPGKREGFLLRKSRRRDRTADDYGLYVLVGDSRGNRLPGAQPPVLPAFARGEGILSATSSANCTAKSTRRTGRQSHDAPTSGVQETEHLKC